MASRYDRGLDLIRRAAWSPTKLYYSRYTPHEGLCQLSLSPPIVGLMRNNLSEVTSYRNTYPIEVNRKRSLHCLLLPLVLCFEHNNSNIPKLNY